MKVSAVILFSTVALAANIRHYVRALPPGAQVNPTTASGVFGPFTPAKTAAPGATGAPTAVSNQVAQQLQQAADNWSKDTGMVSNFLNLGKTSQGNQFTNLAQTAFKAEVDELTWKAVLDKYIGNDPQVSIANLTLTNGVFQSVVDNLDIMAVQGKNKQSLIDTINSVRCVQILPSINTYMLVAARIINGSANGAVQSIPPAACAGILQRNANNPAAFPNVPNVPGGTPLSAGTTGSGNGNTGSGTGSGTTGTGAGAGTGTGTGTGAGSAASSSAGATTGGRGGGRSGNGNGNTGAGNAGAGAASGTTGAGTGTGGRGGNGNAGASNAGTAASSAAVGTSTGAASGQTGAGAGTEAGTGSSTTGAGSDSGKGGHQHGGNGN